MGLTWPGEQDGTGGYERGWGRKGSTAQCDGGASRNVHAAVVTNRTGKQELTFHCAAGPAVAIQMTR